MDTLIAEIADAKREVAQWQAMYDEVIDEPTVDYTIRRLGSAQMKLDALYARAKQLQQTA